MSADAVRIGQLVFSLRTARGWSAQRLSDEAARVGEKLGRHKISDLETARTGNVTLGDARAIAAVFGLSLDQIANFTTPPSALLIAAEIADAKARLQVAISGGGAA